MTEPIAIRIPDAVKMSGIGRSKLYEALKAGEIRAVKAGRRTLILVASIKSYIDSLPDLHAPA